MGAPKRNQSPKEPQEPQSGDESPKEIHEPQAFMVFLAHVGTQAVQVALLLLPSRQLWGTTLAMRLSWLPRGAQASRDNPWAPAGAPRRPGGVWRPPRRPVLETPLPPRGDQGTSHLEFAKSFQSHFNRFSNLGVLRGIKILILGCVISNERWAGTLNGKSCVLCENYRFFTFELFSLFIC